MSATVAQNPSGGQQPKAPASLKTPSSSGRILAALAVIAATCALAAVAAVTGDVGLRADRQVAVKQPLASKKVSSRNVAPGAKLMPAFRLDTDRFPLCQGKSATDNGVCLNRESQTVLWTSNNSDFLLPLTSAKRSQTRGNSPVPGETQPSVQVKEPGVYEVIAQVTAHLTDQADRSADRSTDRTLECSVRVLGKASSQMQLIGRSLSARNPLNCLVVGALTLAPGDAIQMQLSRLDWSPVSGDNDDVEIFVGKPGFTYVRLIRLG